MTCLFISGVPDRECLGTGGVVKRNWRPGAVSVSAVEERRDSTLPTKFSDHVYLRDSAKHMPENLHAGAGFDRFRQCATPK